MLIIDCDILISAKLCVTQASDLLVDIVLFSLIEVSGAVNCKRCSSGSYSNNSGTRYQSRMPASIEIPASMKNIHN